VKDTGEAAAFLLVVAVGAAVLVAADQKVLKPSLPKYAGPAILGAAGVAGFAIANATGYRGLASPLLNAGAAACATSLLDRLTGPNGPVPVAPVSVTATKALPSYTVPVGEYTTYSGEVPGHFKG
jgi:hypothetical protein